jgi:hypothetical protein
VRVDLKKRKISEASAKVALVVPDDEHAFQLSKTARTTAFLTLILAFHVSTRT